MKLEALANRHKQFFAPGFAVRLDGDDLVRDLLVPVSQVEVSLSLGAAAHFSFTVANCFRPDAGVSDNPNPDLVQFRTGRRADLLELLGFGAEIEVRMGYGDAASMPVVVTGTVTESSVAFPEGGSPELTVEGYDRAFSLTVGKNSRTWQGRTESFAVSELAGRHNLGSSVAATDGTRAQIEQNQVSDWEFIKQLADQHKWEFYVDEQSTLHFGPPKFEADPVVELTYGESLLSFKATADLSRQASRVEVYGWDHAQKRALVGVATAGEERGRSRRSAGQILSGFLRDQTKTPTVRVRHPVFSQAEAEQRAEAILNERAESCLTGDADSIGLPELRPDRTVQLSGLGKGFSRKYYIQQATHKVDAGGYRTQFKVKEPRP